MSPYQKPFFVLLVLAAIYLQMSLGPLEALGGGQIALATPLIIYLALRADFWFTLILTTLTGLWLDCLSSATPFGTSVVPLGLIAALAWSKRTDSLWDHPVTMLGVGMVGSMLFPWGQLGLTYILSPIPPAIGSAEALFITGAMGGIACPILAFFLNWIDGAVTGTRARQAPQKARVGVNLTRLTH